MKAVRLHHSPTTRRFLSALLWLERVEHQVTAVLLVHRVLQVTQGQAVRAEHRVIAVRLEQELLVTLVLLVQVALMELLEHLVTAELLVRVVIAEHLVLLATAEHLVPLVIVVPPELMV
jgi:hypothetical protein